MVRAGGQLVVVGGGPDHYGHTQVLDLVTQQWSEAAPPQKDRALHGCTALQTSDDDDDEGGEWAVVVAGNDFSPQDLAEVNG